MSNNTPLQPRQNSNKPVQLSVPDQIIKILTETSIGIEPAAILKAAGKLLQEYQTATGDNKGELLKKLNEKIGQAFPILSLDNHYLMAETLDGEKYRTLAIEIADQLNAEYSCKTTSEKMLAQTAAWAYCHMLEYSYKLNGLTRVDFLSTIKTGYYSMLSKEVDRSNRQYLTAINTLRHLKQPIVHVTFNAHNAFVAQNQQIIATQETQSTEIIDAE